MSSSLPQVVWVQKRKNLKILHSRHTGIVDWHLGIRLGLSVARRRRTHTRIPVPFYTRSLKLHRRIRAGSMTQEPNSWHSLAPLGYPSDPKNHQEPFLLPGASCPHPVFAHSRPLPPFPIFAFLPLARRSLYIVLQQRKRAQSYRELNGGFKKNGKSLRACQSDVRGFAPIWLMMIHCFISRTSAILLSRPNTARWK